MNNTIKLNFDKVTNTIDLLVIRIQERFPNSGLAAVTLQFSTIAKKSRSNIEWISKPNLTVRLSSYLIILLGLCGLIYSITYIDWRIEDTKIANVVAISEAVFNDLILLGAAVFFLVTMESRIKRKRAINQLNELRVIAHVVDMHQLTKDPSLINITTNNTENSPKRTLTKFELERYLNYCSETAALIAKVAALYSQSLPDEVVVKNVNDIESLCNGLSQKVWQKIIILNEK
jgi:hypothetical protein